MLLATDLDRDVLTLRLSGDWSIANVSHIDQSLQKVTLGHAKRIRIDCAHLDFLDLTAALVLQRKLKALADSGVQVEFAGQRPSQLAFVEELAKSKETPSTTSTSEAEPATRLAKFGKYFVDQRLALRTALDFYGRVIVTGLASIAHPGRIRFASIARHVYETGIQAVPIVALIAFLITVVIAYIGAQQLEKFGAEIFAVDLVTVGVLREMGVLLTAIIVAGRSGSSFAAEIGVMQLNDEVDALKSIGMDPYEVLVLPRVIGLVIALPLLTILADTMGLAGGALLCSWLLDISVPQFLARMQDALAPTTFWAGFIKSPVFAFLIAMTGTFRGMQVRDSSRELGRLTTVAVVQAIFLVILANAIFAIIYMQADF